MVGHFTHTCADILLTGTDILLTRAQTFYSHVYGHFTHKAFYSADILLTGMDRKNFFDLFVLF